MKTKDDVKKIGFTKNTIFIETTNGEVKHLELLNFPKLESASKEQRENYEISPFGIHWEDLDEDLSFEGFYTFVPNNNELAVFFKTFPEISMSKFATRLGIPPNMMRHYACGSKTPSKERKALIFKGIQKIASDLNNFTFDVAKAI